MELAAIIDAIATMSGGELERVREVVEHRRYVA